MGLFEKIFGTHSEKELKKINPIVDAIEALDEKMQALSDEELRGKTQEFKDRLAAGETLDDILVEAFAVVREAAYRVLEALQGTAHRRNSSPSGKNRRDENGRRKDTCINTSCLSECP